MTTELTEICRDYTSLTDEDINILAEYEDMIQSMALLSSNDVFIDVLTSNKKDSIVLAWGEPEKNSLYNKSVVGDIAYSENEPGVYRTVTTGELSRAIRGVSQKGNPIEQTVVPIKNGEKTIGALIMERDISWQIEQEKEVNVLKETVEFLKKSLMELNVSGSYFADWLNTGIFVLDKKCRIVYLNKWAEIICAKGETSAYEEHDISGFLGKFDDIGAMLEKTVSPVEVEYQDEVYNFYLHAIGLQDNLEGAMVIVQDITELRVKEKELQVKDAMIREIHHRVKNNLQNIAAILQLQMRRTSSEEAKTALGISISRIRCIAAAQDVFSKQSPEVVNIKELLSHILNVVISNCKHENQKIITVVEGKNVKINSGQAVPISLIANEIITNSMKHGIKDDKGTIRINVAENDGLITLEFFDSGKSKLSDDIDDGKTLGLQIVRTLAQGQLGGVFKIDRVGNETKAVILFKK